MGAQEGIYNSNKDLSADCGPMLYPLLSLATGRNIPSKILGSSISQVCSQVFAVYPRIGLGLRGGR